MHRLSPFLIDKAAACPQEGPLAARLERDQCRTVACPYAPAMPGASLHVVLGAAGGTGSAVVRELAARGCEVRAVTRSGAANVPEGVEQVAADVGTIDGARRACEGASVAYHCAQPAYTKWPQLFPSMTHAILDGAAAAGSKLVFADNLYAYGPVDGPMTEQTPQLAPGPKGRTRIEMADAVLGAHADGKVRCAIGRSSDYYGPRGTATTLGDNLMKPALRGRRARWLGSLDQPHRPVNTRPQGMLRQRRAGGSTLR